MLAKLRSRLTYANVVSTICLCLVVGGGTAYAAATVFSGDIVDGQVKTVDLGNGAVVTAKLADAAVSTGKVLDNHLTGDDVKGDSLDRRGHQRGHPRGRPRLALRRGGWRSERQLPESAARATVGRRARAG